MSANEEEAEAAARKVLEVTSELPELHAFLVEGQDDLRNNLLVWGARSGLSRGAVELLSRMRIKRKEKVPERVGLMYFDSYYYWLESGAVCRDGWMVFNGSSLTQLPDLQILRLLLPESSQQPYPGWTHLFELRVVGIKPKEPITVGFMALRINTDLKWIERRVSYVFKEPREVDLRADNERALAAALIAFSAWRQV